jgi:hypothetical protein
MRNLMPEKPQIKADYCENEALFQTLRKPMPGGET